MSTSNTDAITTHLEVDPDSGLPIGTIVRNKKGDYGMIAHRRVIYIEPRAAESFIAEQKKKERE